MLDPWCLMSATPMPRWNEAWRHAAETREARPADIPFRMPHPMIRRHARAVLALAGLLATLPACKDKNPAGSEQPTNLVQHVYVVRGQVEQLPDPADIRKAFMVRHEEIPEFKGPDGKLGMEAMVMEFPLAEGFKLDGLTPGAKIELTFTVQFDTVLNRPKRYHADSWKPLDPSTVLDFTDRSKER